jgi:hypothetical protein
MAGRAQAVETKTAWKAKTAVQELLDEYHPRDFAVEFWDGSRWDPEPGQFCHFTWHIQLCHWLRRMEANMEEAIRLVGELKARIWRLYLAGSAHYFRSGKLDLYQSLLVKSIDGHINMPLTRADWYD